MQKNNLEPLWSPDTKTISSTQLAQFSAHVAEQHKLNISSYQELYEWSIEYPDVFWSEIWAYCGVIASEPASLTVKDLDKFPGAEWFPGSRINFAQNLLEHEHSKTALVGLLEDGSRRSYTYGDLYKEVAKVAAALKSMGVGVGDRVAGFMPNICETVIAMLATTSLGAVWSSCSPDFGFNGARDRFSQITPKVLFAANAYLYNGKTIDCVEKVSSLRDSIASIEHLVVVDLLKSNQGVEDSIWWEQLLKSGVDGDADHTSIDFEQLPFDHPLYIMYSSGTTGTPKCIVHGAGGTLLQHKKELMLHTDITANDVLFYFTTCGWMMWNWLVSGLACGCTVVLYDGSPFAREGRVLLDAIDEEKISVFGTGAKYISALEKNQLKPRESHKLDSLRSILSTGSPLSRASFDYVYRDFKQDVCLSSICGGTDIISCFILGNPALPVYRGEIQCIGLGMAVEFWDDSGQPLLGEKGELVCVKPFPSTPIGFWNDEGDAKFKASYFDQYTNVWAHGDYGEVTERGTVIIHGRSDAVLNPGGVRIGTAEIYRQVEKFPEIVDSVVVGQRWDDDERVVLFVQMQDGQDLDDSLIEKIKKTIRSGATPRHVPAKIIAVSDIPRTISGKTVEIAVKKMIHGDVVNNTDALANPEALENFRQLEELS